MESIKDTRTRHAPAAAYDDSLLELVGLQVGAQVGASQVASKLQSCKVEKFLRMRLISSSVRQHF